jgi:hypothetical protein
MRKRFGELLLEGGLITQQQLTEALAYQKRTGQRLGAALVAKGALTEVQLVHALGAALRVPVVALAKVEPDPKALRMVSLQLCSEHDLFPYAVRTDRHRVVLTVATSDPLNFRLLDELGFMCDANIEAVLAPAPDIDLAIRTHYGPRLAPAYQTSEVRLALEEDGDGAEMTIYRRGGNTETINTDADTPHDAHVPPAPAVAAAPTPPTRPAPTLPTRPAPPPARREARPRLDSAVLLVDEVIDDESIVHEAPLPQPSAVPTATPTAAIPAAAAPVAPLSFGGAPVSVPPPPVPPQPPINAPLMFGSGPEGAFDGEVGALLDAAHEADQAQAMLRLERKFWALMRVLAKKGLLTNDDFLAELGEEEKWRG